MTSSMTRTRRLHRIGRRRHRLEVMWNATSATTTSPVRRAARTPSDSRVSVPCGSIPPTLVGGIDARRRDPTRHHHRPAATSRWPVRRWVAVAAANDRRSSRSSSTKTRLSSPRRRRGTMMMRHSRPSRLLSIDRRRRRCRLRSSSSIDLHRAQCHFAPSQALPTPMPYVACRPISPIWTWTSNRLHHRNRLRRHGDPPVVARHSRTAA